MNGYHDARNHDAIQDALAEQGVTMSNEKRAGHIDEVNRLNQLARHELAVRKNERRRTVASLVQHEYQTPACDCKSLCGNEHLDPPGSIGTDFDGCVI